MADKNSGKLIVSGQEGVFRAAVQRFKLIWRLMGDRRVSAWVKLLPLGALAYFISPVDFLPGVAFPVIGVLDDAAVLWLGSSLFVELCPPNVVNEHLAELSSPGDSGDEIVDAEATDVDPENK
jgi:uncharacterized membrane protein YkvA (DUF1232 family)